MLDDTKSSFENTVPDIRKFTTHVHNEICAGFTLEYRDGVVKELNALGDTPDVTSTDHDMGAAEYIQGIESWEGTLDSESY